jgi:hypothetical protein
MFPITIQWDYRSLANTTAFQPIRNPVICLSYLGGLRKARCETGESESDFSPHPYHYYLVTRRLALFIQIGWGNVFDDEEIARGRIEGTFGFVESLLEDIEVAEKAGKLPAGQRLAIVDSDFGDSRWAWVPQSSFQADQVTWNEKTLSLEEACMDVRTRLESIASA